MYLNYINTRKRNSQCHDLDTYKDNNDDSMRMMPPPPPRWPNSQASLFNSNGQYSSAPRTTSIRWQPHPQASEGTSFSYNCTNITPQKTSIIRTSAISFVETNHGRERRFQRSIPTRDIQAAIKHGIQRNHPFNNQLAIYFYQGKEHIICKDTLSLVTTMVKSIDLEKKTLTRKEIDDHEKVMNLLHGGTGSSIGSDEGKKEKNSLIKNPISSSLIQNTHSSSSENNNSKIEDDTDLHSFLWTSHSVIIVDNSGSMRNSDVNGSRTRFSAVWLSLAQDYIENRIKSGISGSNDIISIVLMGEKPQLIIDKWPTNYVLYNKIVDFYNQSEEADRLWKRMQHFLKAGYNRDHQTIREIQMKLDRFVIRPKGHGCYAPSLLLAKQLLEKYDNDSCALSLLLLSDGRPSDLRVFKQTKEDLFTTLKDEAGRMASRFGRRFSLSTIGMGSLKEFETLEALVDSAKDFGGIGSFSVPSMSCAAIGRAISSVATSLTSTQTELIAAKRGQQRRVRQCIRENRKLIPLLTEVVDSDEFDIYMGESVEHYEYKSNEDGTKKFAKSKLQHPDAAGVAMKRQPFGEGQERFAFQFFEVGKDGISVVGAPLVAKESRFIHESSEGGDDNWIARDKFAKRFCKVQLTARNAAHEFNKRLDTIVNLDPRTARVSFLKCSIYYLSRSETEIAVIVEEKLHGKFLKWNNNNGWHIGKDDKKKRISFGALDTLNEESEKYSATGGKDSPIEIDEGIFVKKEEVAQAFSHFSFIHSGKRMLICDLQGVYDANKNMFNFTDPVIHYHDAKKEGRSKGVYGRTDLGQKGIQSFFNTHECNCLCDLVTKGFIGIR